MANSPYPQACGIVLNSICDARHIKGSKQACPAASATNAAQHGVFKSLFPIYG
jgi:hypothetical protein